MPLDRKHLIINGKVQGVGFRHHTRKKASELGLSGWVRNLPDGSVEVEVQGTPARMAAFLEWCQSGPPAARVDGIRSADLTAKDEQDFKIRF